MYGWIAILMKMLQAQGVRKRAVGCKRERVVAWSYVQCCIMSRKFEQLVWFMEGIILARRLWEVGLIMRLHKSGLLACFGIS